MKRVKLLLHTAIQLCLLSGVVLLSTASGSRAEEPVKPTLHQGYPFFSYIQCEKATFALRIEGEDATHVKYIAVEKGKQGPKNCNSIKTPEVTITKDKRTYIELHNLTPGTEYNLYVFLTNDTHNAPIVAPFRTISPLPIESYVENFDEPNLTFQENVLHAGVYSVKDEGGKLESVSDKIANIPLKKAIHLAAEKEATITCSYMDKGKSPIISFYYKTMAGKKITLNVDGKSEDLAASTTWKKHTLSAPFNTLTLTPEAGNSDAFIDLFDIPVKIQDVTLQKHYPDTVQLSITVDHPTIAFVEVADTKPTAANPTDLKHQVVTLKEGENIIKVPATITPKAENHLVVFVGRDLATASEDIIFTDSYGPKKEFAISDFESQTAGSPIDANTEIGSQKFRGFTAVSGEKFPTSIYNKNNKIVAQSLGGSIPTITMLANTMDATVVGFYYHCNHDIMVKGMMENSTPLEFTLTKNKKISYFKMPEQSSHLKTLKFMMSSLSDQDTLIIDDFGSPMHDLLPDASDVIQPSNVYSDAVTFKIKNPSNDDVNFVYGILVQGKPIKIGNGSLLPNATSSDDFTITQLMGDVVLFVQMAQKQNPEAVKEYKLPIKLMNNYYQSFDNIKEPGVMVVGEPIPDQWGIETFNNWSATDKFAQMAKLSIKATGTKDDPSTITLNSQDVNSINHKLGGFYYYTKDPAATLQYDNGETIKLPVTENLAFFYLDNDKLNTGNPVKLTFRGEIILDEFGCNRPPITLRTEYDEGNVTVILTIDGKAVPAGTEVEPGMKFKVKAYSARGAGENHITVVGATPTGEDDEYMVDADPKWVTITVTTDGKATPVVSHAIDNARCYPNPVHGMLVVTNDEPIDRYELLNCAGQVLESHEIKRNEFRVDMQTYPSGLYLLHLLNNDGTTKVLKFVKK